MNEPDRLYCPHCGNPNLHHRTVVVGFRRKEDEAESLVVTVNREGARTEIAPLGGRRDELHLSFECEHCPLVSTLRIYQLSRKLSNRLPMTPWWPWLSGRTEGCDARLLGLTVSVRLLAACSSRRAAG